MAVRLNHKVAAIMALILAALFLYSAAGLIIHTSQRQVLDAKPSSYDKLLEFVLPVLPQEDQTSNEVTIIRSQRGTILSNTNRLKFELPGLFIIIFSIALMWKANFCIITKREHYLRSEISLRIGGHSPPIDLV